MLNIIITIINILKIAFFFLIFLDDINSLFFLLINILIFS